ncbi:MAG: flagellar motor protein MotB [Planctomycetota bacterium]
MGRKKKPEEVAHKESWLVSYCDMISLLVTFFLMMMTFSTNTDNDVREVGLQLLGGGGGVLDGQTLPMAEHIDRDAVATLAQELAEYLDRRGSDESATIRRVKDGFSIGFDLDSSFAAGSAVPAAPLVANLRELAPILSHWTQLVVVEGFVEGDFQPTAAFPDAESLGLARASSAMGVLLEAAPMPAGHIQIATAGTRLPRAEETTHIGRASNRRVEIRVISLAAVRRAPRKEA